MNTITNTFLRILRSKFDDRLWSVKREVVAFFTSTLLYSFKYDACLSEACVVKMLQACIDLLTEAKDPYDKGFIFKYQAVSGEYCTVTYELVFRAFGFIKILIDDSRHTKLIVQIITNLLELLLFYTQLITDEIDHYASSPKVLKENDLSDSVRYLCLEIFKRLFGLNEFSKTLKDVFFSIIQEQLETAQAQKNQGNLCWWIQLEAYYCVMSSLKEKLKNCVDKNDRSNEIWTFFSTVIVKDMFTDLPLLTARYLEVLSCFSNWFHKKDIKRLVDFMLSQVTSEANEIVRVYSVHGLINIYENDYDLEDEESPQNTVLHKRLVTLFEACLNTITSVDVSLLMSLLSLMTLLITYNTPLTNVHEKKLMEETLKTVNGSFRITDENQDVYLKLTKLFDAICTRGLCVEAIQVYWLPYISQVNVGSVSSLHKLDFVQNILSTVISHARFPFNKILVVACFLPLVQCMRQSRYGLSFSSTRCMLLFLNYFPTIISEFKHNTVVWGVEIFYDLVMLLLERDNDEDQWRNLSHLISSFLLPFKFYMGTERLENILKVTFSTMVTHKESNLAMLSVFIRVLWYDAAETIKYLYSMKALADGNTACQLVLTGVLNYFESDVHRYGSRTLCVAIENILNFLIENDVSNFAMLSITTEEPPALKCNLVELEIYFCVKLCKLTTRKLEVMYSQTREDGEGKSSDKVDRGDESKGSRNLENKNDVNYKLNNFGNAPINQNLEGSDLKELLEGLVLKISRSDRYESSYKPNLNASEVETVDTVNAKLSKCV